MNTTTTSSPSPEACSERRPGPAPRWLWIPLLMMAACFAIAFFFSRRWGIVGDAAIMHYVAFLMDHGMMPYRDIIDNNMPGAYMTDWLAIHLFGPGPVAWRLFELMSMLVLVGSCAIIARPADWRAGCFAGFCSSTYHISRGATEAGERDWFLMVLLVAAIASLFLALRQHQPPWMAAFALACGAAASIKPIAVLAPVFLLVPAVFVCRRNRQRIVPYLLWSALGALAATIVVFAFLFGTGTTHDFFAMIHGLLSLYVGVSNMSYSLMTLLIGRFFILLLAGALLLLWMNRSGRRAESVALLIGILAGAGFYYIQHKGFGQHRETMLAMIVLLASIEAFAACARKGMAQWLAVALIVLMVGRAALFATPAARSGDYNGQTLSGIERSLTRLGAPQRDGPGLDRQVQCVEMVSGCINALYDLRIVQTTGFLSDYFLLAPATSPVVDALKSQMLSQLDARQPRVMILVQSQFAGPVPEYAPLSRWPQFAAWLGEHYHLDEENHLPGGLIQSQSYRIYLRN